MRTCVAICLTMWFGFAAGAEPDRYADVAIKSVPVGGDVTMLTGAGGNLAVSIGPDGTLLVDDQFAPLADRIQKAIDALGGTNPKLIINTHYHDDHTGGNGAFGQRGVVVAQEQVRYRLLNDASLPRMALPILTYSDRIRIHFNDDEIDVIHFPAGHTDGDSIVWFRNANVLHTGDLFFNGSFPYIDLDGGGTVDGYIANVAKLLETIPADTRIIPGHGPLGNVVQLGEFHDMLKATVASIKARIAMGESPDSIAAAGLGPEWAQFGNGLVHEDEWIKIIHDSVTRTPATDRRRN
jgi:glyoxylase-like metal-dependent hydrolase (beta-lactamase superfamily II)